ncbi:MAG TPA: glucuronate isomerase [Opitutaceae bacterium]|nr:glucuronate isomerase [Opitutaceae bacterium]
MAKTSFIHEDFLLTTKPARELYHRYAEREPIFDYHCHLSQQLIADNHEFADLAELWLGGDHYKWRAMRTNGVDERFVTGRESTPREKFQAWAETVPHTLGNPLFHWTHLELKRYFGVDELLDGSSAERIWKKANAKLPKLHTQDLLAQSKVAVVCTTDDPADSLETHARIRRNPGKLKTRVYPAYRPDKALAVANPAVFNPWVEKLAGAANLTIRTFDDLVAALKKRHDDFHAAGGRLSDHGLEFALSEPCTLAQARTIFDAARAGKPASPDDAIRYGSYLMFEFGRWDAARGWTKQLHLGALRNNNARLLAKLGPDTGFDSIGDFPQAAALARYLNTLDSTNELPRTIIYNLNPADNYVFATMIGNFQDGTVAGKLQFGSGWWFLDQKEAMEWQINALSNLGLLSRFVGMLTDSRSFVSYPRHEYFRRVLCNLLGAAIARGEIPNDMKLVGGMVKNICFANARDYFRLELAPEFAA